MRKILTFILILPIAVFLDLLTNYEDKNIFIKIVVGFGLLGIAYIISGKLLNNTFNKYKYKIKNYESK